jgi:vitamin B12 transporter
MRIMPFTAIPAAVVFAVSGPAVAAGQIEQVIVTATRSPAPLDQVTSSVTVLDSGELQRRQTVALSEVLRSVPGLAVSRSGVMGSSTQIRVRGAEGNHVMVMIDGVEANDMAQGDEFNFAHLLAYDVERIEVVRGPQSALWGSDALAGAINIITARGEGPFSAHGFVEGGSFGTLSGGASVSGGGEGWHFHGGVGVLDSDGSNIARTGSEDDGYENLAVSFNGDVQANPWLTLSAGVRHVDARNEYDETDFATGLPADSDAVTDADQDYAQIRADIDPFDGSWTQRLTAAWSATDNDNTLAGADTGSNRGERWTFGWQSDYRFETSSVHAADHVVTLALEHEYEDFTQRGPIDPFAGDPNQDHDARTTSIVGEYRLGPGERLSASVGARHDINSEFQDDTTWRVSAGVAFPESGSRLRASYGTGSKNPTFTERFGFFDSPLFPFVGNPDLEPERSRGWEAGLAQEILAGRLLFDIVWFDESLHDEINGFVFDPATFSITAENTDGVSRRKGLEVTATATVSDELRFNAFYTYLDATQPDGAGGRERELRRPRHTGGAGLNWSFGSGRGNLNFQYLHTGEQDDLFFPPLPPFVLPVELRAFDLLSVSASWSLTPRVTLQGRIENALDDDYEEVYGFTASGVAAYAGVRIALLPR